MMAFDRMAGLLFILSIAMVVALASGCARPRPVAAVPEEVQARRLEQAAKVTEHHLNYMRTFLEDNPRRKTGGIVFIGDSITQQFPIEEAMRDNRFINRGIGGNRVEHVRGRLDTSVGDLAPGTIYLKIGINDLWWGGHTAESLAPEYEELLKDIRALAPRARLCLLSTLPTHARGEELNAQVARYNESIRGLAAKYRAEYVDLWPTMATEAGALRPEYTNDGVHLILAGNLAWMNAILTSERDTIRAVRNLAPRWREGHGPEWPVAAITSASQPEIAGGRGTNQLVIYTPDHAHPTTLTNEWGSEVTVIDGIVTGPPHGNDSPIPANGMVLSGHGTAGAWINGNLTPGSSVELRDSRVVVAPQIAEELLFEFWHAVAAMDARGATAREWRAAEGVLRRIRRWHDMAAGDARDALRTKILSELRVLHPERYR